MLLPVCECECGCEFDRGVVLPVRDTMAPAAEESLPIPDEEEPGGWEVLPPPSLPGIAKPEGGGGPPFAATAGMVCECECG